MLEQQIESKISRQQLVVHGLRLRGDSFSVTIPEVVPRQRPVRGQ